MTLVIASRPSVSMDIRVATAPKKSSNIQEKRPISLDGLSYHRQIGKVLVTNVEQALDTLSQAVLNIENATQKIADEQETQDFTARIVIPRTPNATVVQLRTLESSDNSIQLEEKTHTIDLKVEPASLDELSNVTIDHPPKHGDALIYDEAQRSWTNKPLDGLEKLRQLKENTLKPIISALEPMPFVKTEFTLEDAADVAISGFPVDGQVLAFSTEAYEWQNRTISQVESISVELGVFSLVTSTEQILRTDLKRQIELDELKNTIIEAPRKGETLQFDGHVWRNTLDNTALMGSVMSFVSFPTQSAPHRGIEFGLDASISPVPVKISLKNGVSVGSKYIGESVADDTLVVGTSIGIGTARPQNSLEIIGKSKGQSGLRLTRLARAPAAQSVPVLGIDEHGDVVIAQSLKKFTSKILCEQDGLVTIHHNLGLGDAFGFHITVLDTSTGDLCSPAIRHATANTVTLRLPLSPQQYAVTLIG